MTIHLVYFAGASSSKIQKKNFTAFSYIYSNVIKCSSYLNIRLVESYTIMPGFLFQPDPIDGYEFHPIPIDIHLGIIKIPTQEILHDDAINNTEAIIVGTDRKEVLDRIQTTFTREFQRYGKIKESDIRPTDYVTRQAWTRIRKHIKNTSKKE